MTNGLFISYRRSDSAGFAGRIADYFAHRHHDVQVFFDVISIEPGQDFVESIDQLLESSTVVLVPIGANWLEVDPVSGRRRIDDPDDLVRRELATAFARGARVIPVLLDDATMPPVGSLPEDLAQLTRCSAELMRHATFARDVQHLGEVVVGHLRSPVRSPGLTHGAGSSSLLREALIAAFDTFGAEWSPGDWMICDAPSGGFVQFYRKSDDFVILDLPVEQLDPPQRGSAGRLILEEHGGGMNGDGLIEAISLQLQLPMRPSDLAHMTLEVFDRVFDERALGLLTITYGSPTADQVEVRIGDRDAG